MIKDLLILLCCSLVSVSMYAQKQKITKEELEEFKSLSQSELYRWRDGTKNEIKKAKSGVVDGFTAVYIDKLSVRLEYIERQIRVNEAKQSVAISNAAVTNEVMSHVYYNKTEGQEIMMMDADNSMRRNVLDLDSDAIIIDTINSSYAEKFKRKLKQFKSDALDESSDGLFDDDFFLDRTFKSVNYDGYSSSDFAWRNADEEKVNEYNASIDRTMMPFPDNPEEYVSWIYDQFTAISGYDIMSIISKNALDLTEEDKQVILDFEKFSSPLLAEAVDKLDVEQKILGEKQIDMAIAAYMADGSTDTTFLQKTNYRHVNLNTVNKEAEELMMIINKCNDTGAQSGFHAELLYNEKTKEYTVAFAGSGAQLADWMNNLMQATGDAPEQFWLASSIADVINKYPGLNINISGHSLGGGLASLVGLMTSPSRSTYTYNAEGVNKNLLKSIGRAYNVNLQKRLDSGNYDITAYHTDNDILTNAQKLPVVASAIGTPVNLGRMKTIDNQIIEKIDLVPPETKMLKAVNQVKGHFLKPIVEYAIDMDGNISPRGKEIDAIKAKYSEKIMMIGGAALVSHQ